MRICLCRCGCDGGAGFSLDCALRRGIVTVWGRGRRSVCTGAAALVIVELVGVLSFAGGLEARDGLSI